MTLALIAGTGGLPPALVSRLPKRPLVCALAGFAPDLEVDLTFRIEHLGSFLTVLKGAHVTTICMAGAIRRPDVDPGEIDADTVPLVPRIAQAIAQGDDAALRIVTAIFQEHGFAVRGAHEIAPDLLPEGGILTKAQPAAWHRRDAQAGETCIAALGAADQGQACLVRLGQVIATEGPEGTEAMLDMVTDRFGAAADMIKDPSGPKPVAAADGILFKAPKPNQDRRADLPVIGLDTVKQVAKAGLAGIVIEADGVMVLDLPAVIAALDARGLFLWVRPVGSPVEAA